MVKAVTNVKLEMACMLPVVQQGVALHGFSKHITALFHEISNYIRAKSECQAIDATHIKTMADLNFEKSEYSTMKDIHTRLKGRSLANTLLERQWQKKIGEDDTNIQGVDARILDEQHNYDALKQGSTVRQLNAKQNMKVELAKLVKSVARFTPGLSTLYSTMKLIQVLLSKKEPQITEICSE